MHQSHASSSGSPGVTAHRSQFFAQQRPEDTGLLPLGPVCAAGQSAHPRGAQDWRGPATRLVATSCLRLFLITGADTTQTTQDHAGLHRLQNWDWPVNHKTWEARAKGWPQRQRPASIGRVRARLAMLSPTRGLAPS